MERLVYPKERTLFGILLAISLIFWLALLVGTVGVMLIYVLFGYVFYLFAHSGLIAYLKGNAVRITATQCPELYERVRQCSERVGLDKVPEAYLIYHHGVFNAMATRFLGRHFIVLYSDIVDAMHDRPDAVNFYIGHELGHIHRKHLRWKVFLAPGSILPLIGAAYSRAREYTCDRYGLACCPSSEDAERGLTALAAGKRHWNTLDLGAFRDQVALTDEFWMSFHEITAGYPWLTKRVAAINDVAAGNEPSPPSRNGFAWFFALFVPNLPNSGGGSPLLLVAIIGVLAAIAIPAYQDYIVRAQTQAALLGAQTAERAVLSYAMAHNARLPSDNFEASVSETDPRYGKNVASIDVGSEGILTITIAGNRALAGKHLILTPVIRNNRLGWNCSSDDLPKKYLPKSCR